jgi:hypothetical protein
MNATLKIGRRHRYNLNLKLSGRCRVCGAPAVVVRFCKEHNDQENARRRARWANGPKNRSDGTPEALERRRIAQRARRAAQ